MADFSNLMGWLNRPKDVEKIVESAPIPFISGAIQSIVGSGRGKKQFLWKFVEQTFGTFPQLAQAIGDCTSHSAAHGVLTLACTEIIRNGDTESIDSLIATEPIYAGSRVLIGGGSLGTGDGSVGAWVVDYLVKYGTVKRGVYGNIDLTKYSGARAKDWGRPRVGPPQEILEASKFHKVRTYSLVKTASEAMDAIQNGYPVLVCSNQGFNNVRDSEGFLKPQGSWAHAMALLGYDDEYKRSGFLCQNSWGPDWVTGPTRHDNPPGSFWIDSDVVEKRMLSGGDSFVISDYVGYPAKEINWGGLFR